MSSFFTPLCVKTYHQREPFSFPHLTLLGHTPTSNTKYKIKNPTRQPSKIINFILIYLFSTYSLLVRTLLLSHRTWVLILRGFRQRRLQLPFSTLTVLIWMKYLDKVLNLLFLCPLTYIYNRVNESQLIYSRVNDKVF